MRDTTISKGQKMLNKEWKALYMKKFDVDGKTAFLCLLQTRFLYILVIPLLLLSSGCVHTNVLFILEGDGCLGVCEKTMMKYDVDGTARFSPSEVCVTLNKSRDSGDE